MLMKKRKRKLKYLNIEKIIQNVFYRSNYFYLGNQEEEQLLNFPNSITIKGSILAIILNPENKKIICINFYNSFNRLVFINNEFIIDIIQKLTLQERKENINYFQKIVNSIMPKSDLYEQITNIIIGSENYETQLDRLRLSKENNNNTELLNI